MHPLDLKAALFASHAQHVVLVHFPIALFIIAFFFDALAQRLNRHELAEAAYCNLLASAVFTVPSILTGLIAWQWALEGHKLKGILLYHLVSALCSGVVILLSWLLHFRVRRKAVTAPSWRLVLELIGVLLLIITGHLGGFLSGVNGGP